MNLLWQLVTINSEWLVDSMDSLSPTLSKEWIGLILLPVVSSLAGGSDSCMGKCIQAINPPSIECVTAVNVSVRDQLTLSISVAVGSSIVSSTRLLSVIPRLNLVRTPP